MRLKNIFPFHAKPLYDVKTESGEVNPLQIYETLDATTSYPARATGKDILSSSDSHHEKIRKRKIEKPHQKGKQRFRSQKHLRKGLKNLVIKLYANSRCFIC